MTLRLGMLTTSGEHSFWIQEGRLCRVGRNALNEVVLDHPTVASFHCVIDFAGPAPTIRDLGSHSGIYINDAQLGSDTRELSPNDRIRIGALVFIVELETRIIGTLP